MMKWTDGSIYKGHWVKGVQHGIGIMKFPNGKSRAGFFEKNIFVLPLKDMKTLDHLAKELPKEILVELREYLKARGIAAKEQGDAESEYLRSE